MQCTPANIKGYDLLHQGVETLAKIERNGILIDREYCFKQQEILENNISHLQNKILETHEGKSWKNKFKDTLNLFSGKQLRSVLYEELKIKSVSLTEKGDDATDEAALMKIEKEAPFVRDYLLMKKYDKARGTYIENFIRESSLDGYLHPFFDLHTTLTYRSSSGSPNFQNIPIRNKLIGPMLRSAIIPRPGNMILEADYSGVEVRGAACYHRDPRMIEYINDPTKDMHRDMAMQIYMISLDQMKKEFRQAAKNSYVFPSFYGSYYKQTARDLWDRIETDPLILNDKPIYKHLHTQGIKCYDQFENHVKNVDQDFWENRFQVYNRWKKDWYKAYLDTGYFDSLTGFRYSGYMKRNDVINYPVQGSSFHCLLWSLIHIQKEIELRKLESKIIGQIHDSIILDIVPDELNLIMLMLYSIMTIEIRKVWKWIIVPLEIEVEATGINEPWATKKPLMKKECNKCYSHYYFKKRKGDGEFFECAICKERILI